MIFKSSPAMRDAWCQYSLALANYHITNKDGKKLNKREIFERLYEDPTDGCNHFIEHNHTELALIMSGMHSEYFLIHRTDIETQEDIDEIMYDELRKRAVVLARELNISKKFNDTVSAMIEAMKYAIENYLDINHSATGKIVKKKS